MAEIDETVLPGIGVRYDVRTDAGGRLGVLVHRGGRRELLVYDAADPDRCAGTVDLDEGEARSVAELLGPSQVVTRLAAMQQEIEGLVIDWIAVDPASSLAGSTLGESAVHTQTGASVVAILRNEQALPAPGAHHTIEADDVIVAVGTLEGVSALAALAHP
ncbi:MAG TPA: cation:proton antiporter regulatory subunit [Acidimicrobiales bacterium]